MKYDIYYINLQMELIPELEFFLDDIERKSSKKFKGEFIEI
jgi:hypothetical protein